MVFFLVGFVPCSDWSPIDVAPSSKQICDSSDISSYNLFTSLIQRVAPAMKVPVCVVCEVDVLTSTQSHVSCVTPSQPDTWTLCVIPSFSITALYMISRPVLNSSIHSFIKTHVTHAWISSHTGRGHFRLPSSSLLCVLTVQIGGQSRRS